MSIEDRIDEELFNLEKRVKLEVEPTDEEKRNGWTKASLSRYLSEMEASRSVAIDPQSLQRRLARRPDEANHRYRPLRWRT